MNALKVGDIRPNTVISFRYNGGTKTSPRLVKVLARDATHIQGEDLEETDNRYRNFLTWKIEGDAALIADEGEEVVPLPSFLPTEVRDTITGHVATSIYRLMFPDRKNVRFSEDARLIVHKSENVPRIEVNATTDQISIDFISQVGGHLGIDFSGQFVPFSAPIVCRLDQLTASQFATQLAAHFATTTITKPAPDPVKESWEKFVEEQAKQGNGIYASSR